MGLPTTSHDKRRYPSSLQQQQQQQWWQQQGIATGRRGAESFPSSKRPDMAQDFMMRDSLSPVSCGIENVTSLFSFKDDRTVGSSFDEADADPLRSPSSETTMSASNVTYYSRKSQGGLYTLGTTMSDDGDDDTFFKGSPPRSVLQNLGPLVSSTFSDDDKKGGRRRFCKSYWLAAIVALVLLLHGVFALGIFLFKIQQKSASLPSSGVLSSNQTMGEENDENVFVPSSPSYPTSSEPPSSPAAPPSHSKAGQPTDPSPASIDITTSSPVVSPITPGATIAPTMNERLELIQSRIHKAIPGNAVLNSNSLQYKVAEWLAFEDPFQLPLFGTPLSVLLERYVLALLYRTTFGYDWEYSYNFMTNTSVCNWNYGVANSGVYCNPLGSVDTIVIYENNLDGHLPSELQVVSSLKVLSLFSNRLTGTIPWELANLRLLKIVDLEDNELKGPLPQSLFTLPLLEQLYLSFNQDLTGSIPATTLGQAWSLERVRMIQCSLTGTVPSEIGLLRSLQVLALSENELTGSLPRQVTGMPKLSNLDLSCNNLSGPIPSGLGRLPNLDRLWIQGNVLTGDLDSPFCDISDFMADCVDTDIVDHLLEEDILVHCDCCHGCMGGWDVCSSR